MKDNYLKSYFKSFGWITTVIAIVVFIGLGYIVYGGADLMSESLTRIIYGALMTFMAGSALCGLTSLKSEKISFVDFFRVTALVGSLGVAILLAVTKGSSKSLAVYCAITVLLLFELVIRFINCEGEAKTSIKYYFGALASKYNPLVFVILGGLLAVVGYYLVKENVLSSILNGINISSYKYMILGAALAGFIAIFIPALDKECDVTLFDLFLAIGFIASMSLAFLAVNYVGTTTYKLILVIAFATMACLIVRGLAYNKDERENKEGQRVRAYFKKSYQSFDVVAHYAIGFALAGLLSSSFVMYGKNNVLNQLLFPVGSKKVLVIGIVSIILSLACLAAIVFGKNKKSKGIEKVDRALIEGSMVFAFMLPLLVMVLVNGAGELDTLKANPVLYGALAVNLALAIAALVVTIIRIKAYEPAYACAVAEEPAEAQAEETAEEPVEEVAEETAEEPVEEAAEETAEETVEEAAEETAEEPVEEAAEETTEEPVEEVTEEPAEEADDEEPEDEEAEEDEPEDEEPEEAAEETTEEAVEEAPAEEKKPNLVINDYKPLDGDGKPKKIKRKFNTKMMYAPQETKEYYSEIKNYLMLYRAKGRNSSRCETFRYKGLLAKVALGGKSVKVYLALDPQIVEEMPKYHLKDASEKKQYKDVPVMIKVRSQRSLKYFKELVDMMMAQREVKPKRRYEPTDFAQELIPNGEAILATLGMSTDYLYDTMNVQSIPSEMPENLADYLPALPQEALAEEEVEIGIYLDTLCAHFEDGDVVTLDILKEKNILNRGNVLRVKARGTLDRKLTIYADRFDEDALKMLMCTNCTAVLITRE